jgi:hypothetical protein
MGFDVKRWQAICDTVRATDNDPPYRDEQRAFYDSVRDLLALENAFVVRRIRHAEFDWRSAGAEVKLRTLLGKV